MGKYSVEEIRAFKLKDKMNCRQSALKAAATNNEGKGKKAEALKKEADVYYEWLRQDQDTATEPSKESDSDYGKGTYATTTPQLPEPTLAQKKVLDAICKEVKAVGIEQQQKVYTKVLDWAKEVHGSRSYPTKISSVEEFVKWYIN